MRRQQFFFQAADRQIISGPRSAIRRSLLTSGAHRITGQGRKPAQATSRYRRVLGTAPALRSFRHVNVDIAFRKVRLIPSFPARARTTSAPLEWIHHFTELSRRWGSQLACPVRRRFLMVNRSPLHTSRPRQARHLTYAVFAIRAAIIKARCTPSVVVQIIAVNFDMF